MSGARAVRLTPKALALLSFMAERPGEVVTKEELFGAFGRMSPSAMPRSLPVSRNCARR